jgi:5-hydroxyisourate hydrolase
MSTITTHVLDTVLGKPAVGIAVRLEKHEVAGFVAVATSATDSDGRCRDLTSEAKAGIYRLTFYTGDYTGHLGRSTIYPEVAITFQCSGEGYYHLPLLLSDNSYTTYRGS